jgi:hypothetical protein
LIFYFHLRVVDAENHVLDGVAIANIALSYFPNHTVPSAESRSRETPEIALTASLKDPVF